MITFTNPRRDADIENYPMGGQKRGNMYFRFEANNKNQFRPTRQSPGAKPKLGIYGGLGCIVDGSNGKTYILQYATPYNFIKVMDSSFKNADSFAIGFKSSVFPDGRDNEPVIFATLKALIEQAQSK